MRIAFLFGLTFFLTSLIHAQSEGGSALFWTAQDWECEYLGVQIYTSDSTIIAEGKLYEKYRGISLPECGNEHALNLEALPVNNYYFIADCTKEACEVCNGEGSYWQPTVQSQVQNKNLRKNKGQIDGVYKTCHICGGNGAPFQILWIDTFSIQQAKCRTILLK